MGERISDEALRQLVDASTPGPWAFEDPMGPEILTVVANCAADPYDWVWVAQIDAEQDDERNDDRPQAEHEANAALIALSPALAAEVLQLREALEAIAREYDPSDGCNNALTMHDLARAALSADAMKRETGA